MKRKKLITKCNYPWGDFSPTHAINPYLGCAHNCSYCWARDMTHRFGKQWGIPDNFRWDNPLPIENALDLLDQDLEKTRPQRVLLSSMTDPYQPIERHCRLTRFILQKLLKTEWEAMILTKAGKIDPQDRALLGYFGENLWFGVTIDKEPSRDAWNHERMLLLHEAYVRGNRTFVSLEPWIPGVDALEIVTTMSVIGKHFIVGPLNYKGVDTNFYRENLPGLIRLFRRMGVSYYIKPDLMKCLDEPKKREWPKAVT